MSGMVDARPKNPAPLPAQPGKAASRAARLPCLASPSPAQPDLESPSIGGAVWSALCCFLPSNGMDRLRRRKGEKDQDRASAGKSRYGTCIPQKAKGTSALL